MDRTRIFEAAGKLAAKGQLDKAAREYQRILDEDPRDVRALQKLAEIWQKTGKLRESADLLLHVAEGYAEQGFFLKAVAVFKQILKLVPERIEVNQRLAQLYQQLGLVGDATQQFQVVVNHYDKVGNTKESLAALRKMVELDPDNIASQVKLGEMYAREGMTAEAILELRKAAQYLKRNNRLDDFIRVLERMGQLAPDDPTIAKEVAQGFLGQGDPRRALARLQICFRANPRDVETLELLAKAFAALGQQGKSVSVYRELANVHSERRDVDAERRTLGDLLELAPGDEEAVARLRDLSTRHQAPAVIAMAPPPGTMPAEEARAEEPAAAPPPARKPAANVSPAVARILTETDVYLKYGLIPKAAEHILKAIAEEPNSIDAREKLVAILDRQGKSDAALQELARIVELARAAGDRDRDSLFTQDLAQRAPEHPLVRVAAEAAALPEVGEDDEIVIEPDELDPGIPPVPTLESSDAPATGLTPEEISARIAAQVANSLWDSASSEEEVIIEEAAEASGDRVAPDVGDEGAVSAAFARVTAPRPATAPVTTARALDPFAVVEDVAEGAGATSIPGLGAAIAAANAFDSMTPVPEHTIDPQPQVTDRFSRACTEAEFLGQQGLFEDARHRLEEIVAASPGHPRALALLERYKRDVPPEPPSQPRASKPPAGPADPNAFDLGRELETEMKAFDGLPKHSAQGALSEFRKALSATVGAEDSQTHYDLGIAYKEMGLLNEATQEFELALKAGGRRRVVDCLLMKGVCQLERGNAGGAILCFEQALQTPGVTLEASKEAHFEIGRCHEMLGADRKALDHFARVFKVDPTYRDTKAHLARLKQILQTAGPMSRPPVSRPPAPTEASGPPVRPASPPSTPRAPRKVSYI